MEFEPISKLKTYFGKPEEDITILKTLKTHYEMKKVPFSDCYYLEFEKAGISFCFKNERLDSLYFVNGEQYSYKGELPENLNWKMNNKDVLNKFGEPTEQAEENGLIPVWMCYQEKGLQIDFLKTNYDDPDNSMTNICLFNLS